MVIELESGVWLCQGDGVSKTVIPVYAWRFPSKDDAENALENARRFEPLEHAKITADDWPELCY